MRGVLLVAGQELSVNLRRPAFILLTLLVPAVGMAGVLLAALFGGAIGDALLSAAAAPPRVMGYVDQNGLLQADLPAYAGQFARYPDLASATTDLVAGRIECYFTLAPDYLETGRVAVYRIERGFETFASVDTSTLRRFLLDHLLAGHVDAATLDRVQAPIKVDLVRLDEQGALSQRSPASLLGDFLVPYVFAFLFVVALYTASGYLLQGVTEEKEGRVIEVLLSSITPTRLLAGKIVGLGALGLIQLAFWMAMGATVLGTAGAVLRVARLAALDSATLAVGVVYFLLGYLLFATLMAAVGSLGSTARESQQIAGVFSFVAAVPWILAGVVLANPNAGIVVALSYFPLTAPVMMLLRVGFGEVPPEQLLLSVALLVLSIVVSLWLGAKVFRAGLLMVGKRLSLRELARTLRHA